MTYHALTLGDPELSAAFVAAASRAMNSPSTTQRRGIEIWAHQGELYLSEVAMEMVSVAFAPPPTTATRPAVALPEDAHLVLDSATPALGLTDAQRLLTL